MEFGNEIPYERLALWLMDAGKEDIAAYWETHKGDKKRNRDITDLLMIGWTRVDPLGAVAAVKGTGDEEYAWWAWASHDPRAALDAVKETSPGCVTNVAWGIGEFHPEWLRKHLEEIPEGSRWSAFAGLSKWGETDKPEETLEFLMKNGQDPPTEMLGHLVRKDPWAAYEWVKEKGDMLQSRYGWRDQPIDSFYRLLGHAHPDVLEKLAAEAPAGAGKRKMEVILFASLMDEDLEGAIAQAETTRAPRVATERMAAVGLRLLRQDRERAYEVAENLLAMHPNALDTSTRVVHANGGWTSYSGAGGKPTELLEALVAADPERMMGMVDPAAKTPDATGVTIASRVSGIWAQQDLEGFAQWVVDQDDPAIQKRSAPIIANQLQNQKRYEEAAEWASSTGDSGGGRLYGLFHNWKRVDPDRAREWLEAAEIPATEKHSIRRILENDSNPQSVDPFQ